MSFQLNVWSRTEEIKINRTKMVSRHREVEIATGLSTQQRIHVWQGSLENGKEGLGKDNKGFFQHPSIK